MSARKAVSKRTRFEIFKRDGFLCTYCGASPSDGPLHVDHIKPVAEGGETVAHNLATSCQPCNGGKGAVPLDRKKYAGKVTQADRDHLEQLREYMEIQRGVMEAKNELTAEMEEAWRQRCGDPFDGFQSRVATMMKEFGAPRLVEAFDIVAAQTRLYRSDAKLKYLYGILRNWREGRNGPAPKVRLATPPATPKRNAYIERIARAIDEHLAVLGPKGTTADVAEAFFLAAGAHPSDVVQWTHGLVAEDGDLVERGATLKWTKVAENAWRREVVPTPGFNPHQWAWDELYLVIGNLNFVVDNAGPDGPGADELALEAKAVLETTSQLQKWLNVYLKETRGDTPDGEDSDDKAVILHG